MLWNFLIAHAQLFVQWIAAMELVSVGELFRWCERAADVIGQLLPHEILKNSFLNRKCNRHLLT